MSDGPTSKRCPACGGDNGCAMAAAGECWCATEFPPRLPLAASADAACYCRDCLRRMIAAAPETDSGA